MPKRKSTSKKGGLEVNMAHVNKFAFFLLVMYTISFMWWVINPAQPELHMMLMDLMFVGFNGFDPMSYWAGFVQVYFWALVLVYVWDHTVGDY